MIWMSLFAGNRKLHAGIRAGLQMNDAANIAPDVAALLMSRWICEDVLLDVSSVITRLLFGGASGSIGAVGLTELRLTTVSKTERYSPGTAAVAGMVNVFPMLNRLADPSIRSMTGPATPDRLRKRLSMATTGPRQPTCTDVPFFNSPSPLLVSRTALPWRLILQ